MVTTGSLRLLRPDGTSWHVQGGGKTGPEECDSCGEREVYGSMHRLGAEGGVEFLRTGVLGDGPIVHYRRASSATDVTQAVGLIRAAAAKAST
jgi:hypothetical protein